MDKGILIIGCGYTGERLARRLRGQRLFALARGPQQAERLASLGVAPILGDLDQARSLHRLPRVDTVFHLAPPPEQGRGDPRSARLLAALSAPGKRPRRIIYISTTGVYGNRDGAWLDEHSPIQASTARAQRRVDAERQLRRYGQRYGAMVSILRVPGIYGPGRLPLERLRQGQPVVDYDPPHYYNRIHVDDLVEGLLAAARHGRANRLYVASDGSPGTQPEFYEATAAAAGLPPPEHITPQQASQRLSPMTLSFLEESRRFGNRRFVEELQVKLRYADFRQGIADSLPASG